LLLFLVKKKEGYSMKSQAGPREPLISVWLVVALFIWCGIATDVLARPKTDVVTLNNGDRITGETKKLDRGILTFKTDPLNTVSIEWEKVTEIVSEFEFEFWALDGTQYFGSLEKPGNPGTLLIATPEGESLELPIAEISTILPIEAGFWAKIDGSLSLGFDSSSASDETSYSGGVSATRRTRRWEVGAELDVIVTEKDLETTDRENLTITSLRRWKNHWFSGGYALAESNEELGLDLRVLVAGLGGRNVVESTQSRLRLAGGVAVNREKREDPAGTETNLEAVALFSYDLYRFTNPKTDLKCFAVLYHNLSESERLRGEAKISLEHEIVKDFDWVLSAYDTYESDPVGDDPERHDWGVTASFAWDF
jgi:hypothetical protein